MPMRAGSFVWYELMTSDVEDAQKFYAEVVGWQVEDSGKPGMQYGLAKVGTRQVAGFMGIPPEAAGVPPSWFGYILADDVDAMASRLGAMGGTVKRAPQDIPGVGRFAVVADPQGATFMLFQGAGEPPPELAPKTPGTIGWHELHTTDWESAFSFYQSLFGWEKSYAHDMGPMGVYQTFSVGDDWTGGMMNGGEPPFPAWSFYITVEDINDAATRIANAGGKVLQGPHPVPGDNWIVVATDRQGVRFALVSSRGA